MQDKPMTKMLKLVNRKHTLEEHFVPDDLVFAEEYGISVADSAIRLQKCACIALATLTQYAKTQGAGDIVLFSGYRSYEEQKELHLNKIKRLCQNGYSMPRARLAACTVVAPPGASEHQLGLAADVTVPEYLSMKDPLIESFAGTEQGKWIAGLAHAFGFILRYPEDKTESTGVIYEPWHLRYVGAIHARRMYLGKMCLEEYLYAI